MVSEEAERGYRILAVNGRVNFFGKRGAQPTGGTLTSLSSYLTAVANLERAGYDIYIGANPARLRGIKSRTADVSDWRRVVIDVDAVKPECDPTYTFYLVLEALGAIGLGDCTHAATGVFTGRGIQVWLSIDPHTITNDQDIIERSMSGLLHKLARQWNGKKGFEIDTTTSDLARVVRCPGTINTKSGKSAYILSTDHGCLGPDSVLAFAGDAPPPPSRVEGPMNLHRVLPHLTDSAAAFLTRGAFYPTRRKASYAASASLRDAGVPQDIARKWVVDAGRLCPAAFPGEDVEEVLRDMERAVDAAYRKERSGNCN